MHATAHPGDYYYTTSGREKKEETLHECFALSIAVLATFTKAASDETWRSVMIFRSWCLTQEKKSSMGLHSGLYGGVYMDPLG